MRVQLVLEAIDRASRVIEGVHRATAALNNSETVATVQAAKQRASQLQAQAQANLVGAIATSAAAAAPMAKAAEQFGSYEDVLTDVGLKADLSGEKLVQLGERARLQARLLNTASVDLLKGLDKLAEGGLALDKAEPVNFVNAKATIAAKASIEDLSKTAVALVNNLKVLPEQYGRALDAMAVSGKEGQFELKDMARYMPRLGAQYAAMGQTGVKAVADLAAAMQIVQGVTNNSETTAAGLRDVLTKITGEKSVKAFQAIGIDIKQVMKEARAANRPIEAIVENLNKLTGGDASRISEVFGDVQAQSAATALMSGLERFLEIREKALAGQGTIDRDFATRMGLSVEKARAVSVAFSELGTTLGQAFAPMLNLKAEQLARLVSLVESWARANPELVTTIATLVTVVTGGMVAMAAFGFIMANLRIAVLALFTPLRFIMLAFSTTFAFFGAIGATISAGVAAIGGWGAAFGLLAARLGGMLSWLVTPIALVARAFVGLGVAMMTTPIGWIIAGIAAVAGGAYLIYRNWDRLGPWFSQLWASIGAAMRAAWEGIVSFFSGLGGRVSGAISGGWASVTAWFSSLSWPNLPDFPDPLVGIRAVLDPVVTWLGEWGGKLLGAFEGAFGKVTSFIEGAAGKIGAVIGTVTGALGKVSDYVFGPSTTTVAATAEQAAAAKAAVEAIPPAARAAAAEATAVFAGLSFHSHGVALMQTLATGIRAGAASAIAAARETVQQIRDHLPHSPAKVGPLSDLDRVQFGQTLAGAIRAGSPAALAAVQALTAGMAGALPTTVAGPAFAEPAPGLSQPAGSAGAGAGGVSGGGGISVSLTLAPNFSGSTSQDFIQQLRDALPSIGYELAEQIAAEIERRERTKH